MNNDNETMNTWLTDCGRDKLNERRDCTVRATAVALNIPYEDAHAKLAALGRKHGRGFKWQKHFEALGFEMLPELSCMTVQRVIAELPSGRFVVRIARHTFAVVDGTIVDNQTSNPKSRVKMVYAAATLNPLTPMKNKMQSPK